MRARATHTSDSSEAAKAALEIVLRTISELGSRSRAQRGHGRAEYALEA